MLCNAYNSLCQTCKSNDVTFCIDCVIDYGSDNGSCKACSINCRTCRTSDWHYC